MAEEDKEKKEKKEKKPNPLFQNEEDPGYNPFAMREVKHPTTDFDTWVHLVKGALGSGVLAMPMGFKNGGLWFGLVATFFFGFLCAYCINILVTCNHILCFRCKIPKMRYDELAFNTFTYGPERVKPHAKIFKFFVNFFLVLDLFGCCCIYMVFVGDAIKQLVDHYTDFHMDLRLWVMLVTIPLLFLCLIRVLKFLVPFSFVANACIFIAMVITCYYVLTEIPSTSDRPVIAPINRLPIFFGAVIFALECVGVVMPLENEMKNPDHFIGCPSVLVFGFSVVLALYTFVGFFGYLKYGELTEANIIKNLPPGHVAGMISKTLIGIAIFFTYLLQYYVPFNIVWIYIKEKIPEDKQDIGEHITRMTITFICGILSISLPCLGPFITLIGCVCLSFLGLIFPAIIELCVYREKPGYGVVRWRLWKNIIVIIFGIIGFISGTYVSILDFVDEIQKLHEK